MQKYFHVFEGKLYDTRAPMWTERPLRNNYCYTHTTIRNVTDLKATMRHGQYTFPGGYPMFFVTSDGAAISFTTAIAEFENIARAIRDNSGDGWQIVACAINYEDKDLICDHSNEKIEAAYE